MSKTFRSLGAWLKHCSSKWKADVALLPSFKWNDDVTLSIYWVRSGGDLTLLARKAPLPQYEDVYGSELRIIQKAVQGLQQAIPDVKGAPIAKVTFEVMERFQTGLELNEVYALTAELSKHVNVTRDGSWRDERGTHQFGLQKKARKS